MKPLPVLLAILLEIPILAQGQYHTIFHFSGTEGLPSSEVYEVFEDHRGFLWFATDNGVARYDGKDFETFHVRDGLTDPVVFGFQEDSKGNLWFRTFSGRLCYFDGNKIIPYQYNDELIKGREYGFLHFVYDADAHEMWFSLGHHLGKIDKNGRTLSLPFKRPSFIIKSINQHYLQGYDLKYSIKNIIINEKVFPIELTDTTEHKFFNSIAVGNRIFVSLYKDLFEYKDGKVAKVFTSAHPIISLSKDMSETLWLGYLNNGVQRFGFKNNPASLDFLKNKSVTKVHQSSDHGFWFTTLESGVYFVPNFQIENHQLPTASRVKTVLSTGDTVLIGDQAGNLFVLDAKTRHILTKKKFRNEVYALFQDGSKKIWISAGLNTISYNPQLRIKKVYHKLVATVFAEDKNNVVWAYGGIRMTRFNQEGEILSSRARFNHYRTFYVQDTIAYLAGRTGLHLRNRRMQLIHAPPELAEYKISEIESLGDTKLLLATEGNGFLIADTKNWQLQHFDEKNKFPANNIYCVARTDSAVWMGTERGIFAIDTESLMRNDLRFNHFAKRTGLINDKINFLTKVGKDFWAFSDNGFSVIPASSSRTPEKNPTFYIKRIIAGTDTIRSQAESFRHLSIPYNTNHFSFSFGYISFSNQSLFLRYRISTESEWNITNERSVQLLSIAPGNYNFELEYSSDNIHWQTALAPLSFRIDSPWWMKWYTIAAAVGVLLLIGFMFFHHRQSIYRQKNHYLSIINNHQQKLIQSEIETLERERKRIARELHDGVGTNLTAIKLIVSQLLRRQQLPQAEDIEEQFQVAIRELRDIIYGLTPPSLNRYGLFPALRNYVARLDNALAPKITLQTFGPEIRNFEFNIMVFRIVQELITNSIKHSSAQRITIHINTFDDMLNIIYEDDGIGFSFDAARNGLGLDSIESRLRSMNGTLRFDSGDHGVSYTIDIPLDLTKQTQ